MDKGTIWESDIVHIRTIPGPNAKHFFRSLTITKRISKLTDRFCFWHLELRAHSKEQIVQNIMILTTAANRKVYYKEVHILRAVRF